MSYNISKSICFLPKHLKNNINIIHQVKREQIKNVIKLYKLNNIKAEVKSFIVNIDKFLKVANLIICRAGASTIAENLIAGVPAIYIPLNFSSNNHQYLNALNVAKNESGWLIKENEIKSKGFIKLIHKILISPNILKKYSDNCKKISIPKATKRLSSIIVGIND